MEHQTSTTTDGTTRAAKPRGRRGGFVILGAVAILLAISFLEWIRDDTPELGLIDQRVGQSAPVMQAPVLAGGEEITIDLADGEWQFIEFWSVSCEPCRRNRPHIQRLERTHPDIRFLSVNTDSRRDTRRAAVSAYVRMQQVGGDVLLDDGGIQVDYGVSGVPIAMLVDGEGTIARVFRGRFHARTVSQAIESARRSASAPSGQPAHEPDGGEAG